MGRSQFSECSKTKPVKIGAAPENEIAAQAGRDSIAPFLRESAILPTREYDLFVGNERKERINRMR